MYRWKALFAILIILVATDCSKDGVNPVAPVTNRLQNIKGLNSPQTRLWGYWDVFISADRSSVDVIPNREGMMHLNAVRLLEVTPCSTCLKIGNIKIVGTNLIEADLTLIHPYPGLLKLTGFDVRGIFISGANFEFPVSGRKIAWGTDLPIILNADGYTTLFNPTEFPPTSPPALGYIKGKFSTNGDLGTTLNPYMAFRKDAPRCMFEPGGSETRTVKLYLPPGPIHFGYAVDVNWQLVDKVTDPLTDFPPDANCLEAYRISVDLPYDINSSWMSQNPINVEVFDHQGLDTISSVTVEIPGLLAGETSLAYSTQTGDDSWLFSGMITNETGATQGNYPLLVKVADTEPDQNLGQIDAWSVISARVKEGWGWAKTWGGDNHDEGNSVAVDGSDNIYVTGHFRHTVDFDPGPGLDEHVANGFEGGFLSKFDASGDFIGARTWGESGGIENQGVIVDDSGNVYVTGCFSETVDFDPGPGADNHTSIGQTDSFLIKFDSSGDFVWARTWGGENVTGEGEGGNEIAIDNSGRIFVAGRFQGPTDFDPGPGVDEHTSVGVAVFVSKFESNGDFVWARTWEGVMRDYVGGIATDGSGSIYATGYFAYTQDFDPGPGTDFHTDNGGYDTFLSCFDLDGNFKWAQTWGGSYDDMGSDVAVNSFGNIWVAGFFAKTVDFDPGAGVDEHTSCGGTDAYVSEFKPTGEFVLARTWGGPDLTRVYGISIDSQDNVFITGEFQGKADFDPSQFTDNRISKGKSDIFINKLDSDANHLWVQTWGGAKDDIGNQIAVDGIGNTYVTGLFLGEVDFNPGSGVDNHLSNGGYDVFLCKFLPDGSW